LKFTLPVDQDFYRSESAGQNLFLASRIATITGSTRPQATAQKMSSTTTLTSAAVLTSSQSSSTVQSAGNSNDKQPAPVTKQSLWALARLLTVLSGLLLIIASLIIALSGVVLQRLSGQLSNFPLIVLYLNTFIYFVLALSSLIGFYVTFPRPTDENTPKVKRLQFLVSTHATLFVLSLAVSIVCLYLLFMPNPPVALPDAQAATLVSSPTASVALELGVGICAPESLANARDGILVSICQRSTSFKAGGVTLIVFGWLASLGMCSSCSFPHKLIC